MYSLTAESSERQNGNGYVSSLPQHRRIGGSYSQNQLRQTSAQSNSYNTDTAVGSSHSRGLSRSGYAQAFSQPARSGSIPVRLVQSSSLSGPNWRGTKLNQEKQQKVLTRFGLPTAIASGSSVSGQKQAGKRNWPVQQGTPRASKYLPSKLASHQSAAQAASSAAGMPTSSGRRGFSLTASNLFNADGPTKSKTSAVAPARRVSSHSSLFSRFHTPQSTQFHVNRGYNPSTSSRSSIHGSRGQSRQQNANFQPASEGLRYTSSNANTYSAGWNSGNAGQGTWNLPVSGKGRFAPTRTHNIPQLFGGSAIRRLKTPERAEASIKKQQQAYTAPSRQSESLRPRMQSESLRVQNVHPEHKVMRFRPSGEYLITTCSSEFIYIS